MPADAVVDLDGLTTVWKQPKYRTTQWGDRRAHDPDLRNDGVRPAEGPARETLTKKPPGTRRIPAMASRIRRNGVAVHGNVTLTGGGAEIP